MPLKCLSILLLTLFSSTGFTQTQFFGIPLSSSNKKGCPEFTNNVDTNGNLNDRYKSAQKIKNYCQRAEILFSLSEKILDSKKFKGSPFHEMVPSLLCLPFLQTSSASQQICYLLNVSISIFLLPSSTLPSPYILKLLLDQSTPNTPTISFPLSLFLSSSVYGTTLILFLISFCF